MSIDRNKLRNNMNEMRKTKKMTYKEIAQSSGISYCGVWNFLNNATDSKQSVVDALYEFTLNKHYEGRECNVCGMTKRYKASGKCVACTRHIQSMSYFRSAERKNKNRRITEAHETPPSSGLSMPIMSMHLCSIPASVSTRYNPN